MARISKYTRDTDLTDKDLLVGSNYISGSLGEEIYKTSTFNLGAVKSFVAASIQSDVGIVGPTGPQGPEGPTGLTGPAGPTGPTGPQGSQGATGPQGSVGATGPQGIQGPTGTTGAVGPAGLNWQGAWASGNNYVEDDAVGYNGASYFCISDISGGTTPPNTDTANWALLAAQGATGPQGAQGPIGATGAQGPEGPAGPQGPTGPTGSAGPQGATGSVGATGPAGPTGPTGPTGPQGPEGPAGSSYTNDDVDTHLNKTGETPDNYVLSLSSGDYTWVEQSGGISGTASSDASTTAITEIKTITQTEYDAIATPDSDIMYVII